ncbi:MAG: DUF3078 domain-containing protein [Rhodothermales bacterium]
MSKVAAFLFLILSFALLNPMPGVAGPLYTTEDDSTATDPVQKGPWRIDIIGRLAAAQTGSQNWAEGGANTLTSTLGLESKIIYSAQRWSHTHETKFALGALKQDTLDFRKATDEIRIRSSFEYKGDGVFKNIKPTIATDISTQFAAGYNHKKNPFEGEEQLPAKVSGFFAPATFVQTLGFTYSKKESFKQRLGVGAKQTVVGIEKIRQLHKMDPDQSVRFELGIESRTHLDRELFDNVRFKSSLGFFAAFNKPDLPDLLWENEVLMKVNKWLGVQMEFKALYDRDVATQLQLREAFSLGISYDLI